MKLFGIKALALAVLTVSLGSCGLVPNLGSVPQPYQIDVGNLGYVFKKDPQTGLITLTVPAVTVNMMAARGAPDIYNVRYTATIQKLDGSDAVPGDSVVRGVMFTYARGGYKCTTTPNSECGITSKDVYFVDNQTLVPNTANNSNVIQNIAITAGAWALSHIAQGQPAGWVVRFDYEGKTSQGNIVDWTSVEQFTFPADVGGGSGGGGA